MSGRLKPLGEGLGPLFNDLERRVQANVDLASRVREALDFPEKEHVISASCRDATLVVIADSSAWASRIRYLQEQLLTRVCTKDETQFTKLRVKVGRKAVGG